MAALRGALAQFSGDLVGAESAFRESAETRSAIGSVEAVPTWLELAAVEAQLQNYSGLSETLHHVLRNCRPGEIERSAGPLALARLVLLAQRRDWRGWTECLRDARQQLAATPEPSELCFVFARKAAELAAEAGQEGKAAEARDLADRYGSVEPEMPSMTVVDGMLARLPG